MIDILYVSYNRLEMTRESFTQLMRNTSRQIRDPHYFVNRIYVLDDGSTDGTREWLEEAISEWEWKFRFTLHGEGFHGPVAAMNWYLDHSDPLVDSFCKIDNDFVVPPDWLEDVTLKHFLGPEYDCIGFEPMHADMLPCPTREREVVESKHIGGKGIIRKRSFTYCRPSPGGGHGYGGFTEWQTKHKWVKKGWIVPDLPAFGLDQLPFEPWKSLTDQYVREGWQRRWSPYPKTMHSYWDWFTPILMPA